MISRRDWLRINAGAGLAIGLNPLALQALQTGAIRTRAIPSSGVQIPVIGLGGGVGCLPSRDHLRRMLKLVASLPGG